HRPLPPFPTRRSSDLSPIDRERWRQMFDHYVFRTDGDPVPYLPQDRRGILGPLFPSLEGYMRAQLIRSLAKGLPRHLREQILRLDRKSTRLNSSHRTI